MRFFDSHAHISSEELMPHIPAILKRAHDMRILNICTDAPTFRDGLKLASQYPNVQNAGATTPHDVSTLGEQDFPLFRDAALSGKLVAVGETGLEYFHPGLDHKLQQHFLRKYLHLALEAKLPVIFHCREAFADLFTITDSDYQRNAPAVLHCFTGTPSDAEGVLKRGWYLSLSGIVTYKKSDALRQIAKMVPLKQLLIETDAPYLAPQSKRGSLNEPGYILETARCIAEVKGVSLDTIATTTFENASKVFSTRYGN